MSSAISIQNLCFGYDTREILHNIALEIEEGSFCVMVGPNGGGKSTLLKLVLGLLEPIYGEVRVFGKTPVEARREVGYVPQSMQVDAQFPVTVEDVVLMGRVERHLFGRYNRRDREVAEQALTEVNLAGFGKRPFCALSGGERQRVIVAQALASEPRMLLLDEPGANLDPENRQMLYELLGRLNKRLTIVLVSHNLNVVASVATDVICVNRTADMHPMEEVIAQGETHGIWAHLHHTGCPISDPEMENEHTPHRACLHCGQCARKEGK